MAKNFFDDEISNQSKFNEGMLQMRRIHELQEKINYANLNPLDYFPDANLYGYKIIFNSLNSLFSECSSKLTDDEKEEGRNLRLRIEKFLIATPIHILQNNSISHHQEVTVNHFAWLEFKELLFDYELLIREFLEKHNMTTPTEEDEGL